MVLFADLQAGIADLPLTVPYDDLRSGVAALVKLIKIFNLPVVISGVAGADGPPRILYEISSSLPDVPVLLRMVANSYASPNIAEAIRKTGRKTILISGVATEVAVQLPSLALAQAGYDVRVVVDACAGIKARTEDAAFRRMTQAGVQLTSLMTTVGELVTDFSDPFGQLAIPLLFELARS